MLDYLVRAYLWYGSSCSRRPVSVSCTRLVPPERAWRFTLRSLWPRLWRRLDAYRLKPFAVLRKRLAAARLVFNLGIDYHSSFVAVAPVARHALGAPATGERSQVDQLLGSVTSSLVQRP